MSDWFQTHNFIVNYLNTFQYVLSTEGDLHLKDQYYRYITSESCKLAQTSNMSGEQRLSGLKHQAEAIQQEFGKFKLLSDMKRRDREEKDKDRLQSLHSKAQEGYRDQHGARGERRTGRRG